MHGIGLASGFFSFFFLFFPLPFFFRGWGLRIVFIVFYLLLFPTLGGFLCPIKQRLHFVYFWGVILVFFIFINGFVFTVRVLGVRLHG